MASEPALFALPYHRTFVRCVELAWPLEGLGHQAVCRSCPWSSGTYASYPAAWALGLDHMREPANGSSRH